jgi:MFS family permease
MVCYLLDCTPCFPPRNWILRWLGARVTRLLSIGGSLAVSVFANITPGSSNEAWGSMSENNPYAILTVRDFRLLLIGRLFVAMAMQIQGMAVGWQIYALTKSALSLGLIGLAEALPAIGVALYAGHVADAVSRRLIAVVVVGILAVSVLMLGFSTYGIANAQILVPVIFFFIAISGFARGFYAPAVFGMISDIVPRQYYGNAAAWNTATWQGSAVGGPILGGFIYVCFGPAMTYLFAVLLLAVAFVSFFLIKSKAEITVNKNISVVENIREGIRFVFSNQIVLGAMALDLFAVLFGGAVAVLPIFTCEVFHLGPNALGMLRAAPAVGSFFMAAYLTHKPLVENAGALLLLAVAGFGLCMIGFGVSTSFYLSLFVLAVSGALDGISIYVRSTVIQLVTPNEMKGRVAAVNSIFINSSNEIGEFESGVAAKLMGLVPSVVFGGLMTLAVVTTTAWKAPKLRNLHMHELYHPVGGAEAAN